MVVAQAAHLSNFNANVDKPQMQDKGMGKDLFGA